MFGLEMKNFLKMDYDEIFTQELLLVELLIVELLAIQVMKMRNHLTLLCHCEYTLVCFYFYILKNWWWVVVMIDNPFSSGVLGQLFQ